MECLIRELMRDPLLLKYSVVMVDEAHERSIHTDIIVGLLKKILKRRADLRVIVSSATLDAEAVRDFFNQDDSKGKSEEIATIITIEGRAFPVDVFYISSPVPDYVKATMETILKIHKHEKPGDILAFLTGQEEVEHVCALVREAAESMQRVTMQLLVLPMYASLTAKEQLKVFQRTPEKTRKVVIATNIAEASITINGITYVIDCGFVKLRAFNPDTGSDCLVVVPVSQASAEQRSGRAGRVRSGKSYRLYPEEEHAKLPAATVPEMQRSDLSTVLLLLKALGVSNVLRFNFLSKPPAQNMSRALDLLYALGAIDVDGKLTEQLGQQMAEFPLEPMFAKMLLESGKFECSEEILSIAAMLNIECVFTTPSIGKAKADRAKYQFSVEEGDHLTLLNVYESFIKKKKSARWCHENYLNYKGLMRVVDVRNQLKGLLQRFEIPLVSAEGDADRICRCIAAGFFANAARLHYTGEYRTVKDDLPIHVHPSSVLYALKPAQWVMFNEVLLTSRAYMRNVTAIDPRWLYELAPHYYQYGTEREIAAKRMKTGT
ncbi:PREDICTED: probable ATP-dependent RNA helicase DHX35 [Priapulus caudatus]|uniref:RNA helicase n=1 Tax=Priapulus caudatus TaxID=37621 RepID=A0ABM1EV75_PRICU|nr:PREDICTED: probable ATP-dependent RNA helicase DHX35 [Priapulus caudatus]